MSLKEFIEDHHKVNYEEMLKLYIYARRYDHQQNKWCNGNIF